ncbi:protein DpdF [Mycolicibacterium mucogenicum]|uniref:protein DpdF n=1 Tax=Mycolicibacterium mucogenicum TaxID=56689 RepID=UPI00226A1DAC|nr:protein DpdF [Mycolicibacterium mucogenicum]MCX8557522.1 protein DpdF [Mycolicibacterium mucogenicum]
MTHAQLECVQDALLNNPIDRGQLEGPFLRLADAWTSNLSGAQTYADILALVSHVLHHHRLTSHGRNPALEVNLGARDIPTDRLEDFGLIATQACDGRLRLEPGESWNPPWLTGNHRWIEHAIASPRTIVYETQTPISTDAQPITRNKIPVDPAVRAIAPYVTHYKTAAQATALRAVSFAETGSTIHVVLPTGSGKSLVGTVPGLIQPSATTVFVVPTVALALDQEQQARTRYPGLGLPRELAYHGSLSVEDKRSIRDRLSAGSQRLLFTSPESFVQDLARPLRELAGRGGLTYVVVDEAHLVYAWGTDFRPEFQLAASLVRELRAISRQRGVAETKTVLMTATLSAPALELNDQLFSDGRSTFVGTNYLRTELRYLMAETSHTQRAQRVTELMQRCPKPAIVYTTNRQDAEDLAEYLRAQGFGRTAAFHGDVSSEQRETVLREWTGSGQKTALDIVVGTTAFGLGIDQADVRTVVHACIPRSVDRFYQEVGRAGRDGHTAVSIWLPDSETDFAKSRIELTRLIGHQKGWSRWNAMRDRAESTNGRSAFSITVDLRTVPPHGDIDSEKNRLWNRNIITILRRAGVIEIAPMETPELRRISTESDAEWEKRASMEWENFHNKLDITVTVPSGSLDEAVFNSAFQQVRLSVKDREDESFRRIRQLLESNQCWGRVFAAEYSLRVPNLAGADYQLSSSCSGCPDNCHTNHPDAPPVVGTRSVPMVPPTKFSLMPSLIEALMNRNLLLVTYDPAATRQSHYRANFRRLVAKATANGIKQIQVSERLDKLVDNEVRRGIGHSQLILVDSINLQRPRRALDYPSIIIAADSDGVLPTSLTYPPANAITRILVVPTGTPTADRPHLTLEDVIHPNASLSDLVRRL